MFKQSSLSLRLSFESWVTTRMFSLVIMCCITYLILFAVASARSSEEPALPSETSSYSISLLTIEACWTDSALVSAAMAPTVETIAEESF